jgi:hypothetical protein
MDTEAELAALRERISAQVAQHRKCLEEIKRLLSPTLSRTMTPILLLPVYHDD